MTSQKKKVLSQKGRTAKAISVDDFAEGLAQALQRMRACNIETLENISPDILKGMSEDDLMKLDWELLIFDMFNIVYACTLSIGNEQICSEALNLFHANVGKKAIETSPLIGMALQNECEAKYRAYDDAIHSSDPIWNLAKEAWCFIIGKPCDSAIQTAALMTYFKANQKFIMSFIKDIAEKHALADKWNLRIDETLCSMPRGLPRGRMHAVPRGL